MVWCQCSLSRVHEGDHDVARPLGGVQALVVVGQPARVHEHPAHPRARHLAVVPQKPAATALELVMVEK